MPKKFIPAERDVIRQIDIMARDFSDEELERMGGKQSLRKAATVALTDKHNRQRTNTNRNNTARKSGLMDVIEDEAD
jgi:hypothetical protein